MDFFFPPLTMHSGTCLFSKPHSPGPLDPTWYSTNFIVIRCTFWKGIYERASVKAGHTKGYPPWMSFHSTNIQARFQAWEMTFSATWHVRPSLWSNLSASCTLAHWGMWSHRGKAHHVQDLLRRKSRIHEILSHFNSSVVRVGPAPDSPSPIIRGNSKHFHGQIRTKRQEESLVYFSSTRGIEVTFDVCNTNKAEPPKFFI